MDYSRPDAGPLADQEGTTGGHPLMAGVSRTTVDMEASNEG